MVVFAGVSFGVNSARESGLKAPASITVDGKPLSLQEGNTFLFFYDPTCTHCEAAARKMAKLNWKDTKVVAIPIDTPQFAASFLHDTGFKAGTSNDLDLLRGTFKFATAPYGVALVRGHQKATIDVGAFEKDGEPAATLQGLGFIAVAFGRVMEITLTPNGEGLLRASLARHPDQSPAQIVEQALAERVEREETIGWSVGQSYAKNPTPEEFDHWLKAFAQFSDKIPPMPGETFSRRMIYQDHD